MRARATAIILLSGSIAAAAATTHATEWSRFRGPNGTGVVETSGLPTEMSAERNRIWTTPVPPGHSSPILDDRHVFLTAHENDKLLVIALDRANGKELWRREVPRTHKGRLDGPNGPASPSAVTDGRNVYAFFQDFGLIAFTTDGKERWRLPLGPFNIFYGFGASPILVDGLLLLPVDQDSGSFLLAVDADSGKVRYKVDRPGVISGYSTPTVFQPANGPKQIIIPESFQLSSYSVADGKRVWWVRGLACEMKSVASIDGDTLYVNGWGFPQNQPGAHVPTIPFEEGLAKFDQNKDGVIAGSEISGTSALEKVIHPKYGFPAFDLDRNGTLDAKEWDVLRAMLGAENGLLAIKLGGEGDMTASAIKWKYQRPVPQVPSTVLYGGALFMVNDSGILISFDPATGKVIKQGRLKGAIDKYFASPIASDGRVFLISQDGTMSVITAKGEWEVLAVNAMGDEVFATPAIDNGRMYVRTKTALHVFGTK
jgi:outer membrane protein assembly factor BamB